MHLHLLLTESPQAEARELSSPAATALTLDALIRLAPGTVQMLSRGAAIGGERPNALPWQWFRAPSEAGTAAYTALADDLPVGNGYWLRVDPVHLSARRDDLSVHAVTRLSHDEASEYLRAINTVLKLDGLEAVHTVPDRWYLRLPVPPDLTTTALSAMNDLPMGAGLPQGADAGSWLRRMTELQMVLHTHPVNVSREARGDLPVNGVWPWGGGCLPSVPLEAVGAVYGTDPLLRGLARHAGGEAHPVPAGMAHLAPSPRALVQFDGALDLAMLEDRWMSPIRQALRRGALAACEITFKRLAQSFHVSRSHLWRFWRTPSVDLLRFFEV